MSGFFTGRRSRVATVAALTVGALAAGVGAVQAQVYFGYGAYRFYDEPPIVIERPLEMRRERVPEMRSDPSLDVRAMLTEDGYRVQGRIQRKGPVYLADVIDLRGRSARLIIDADSGDILERFYGLNAPRPPRDIAGVAPRDDEFAPRLAPEPLPPLLPQADKKPAPSKPAVASRETGKPIAPPKPKTPDRKPLPSGATKPPQLPDAAASTPKAEPAPVAAARPAAKPRIIAPELTGPAPGQAPSVTTSEPQKDSAASANGVPVNPLD